MNNHNYILNKIFCIVYGNSMCLYSIRLERIKKEKLILITLQSYEIVNGWWENIIHQLTSLV